MSDAKRYTPAQIADEMLAGRIVATDEFVRASDYQSALSRRALDELHQRDQDLHAQGWKSGFVHWSKDPLIPYDGCRCGSCEGARTPVHVTTTSQRPERSMDNEWRSALNYCITIPRWLGGAWTCSYMVRHAWTRWLILLPIIKWKEWRYAHTPGGEHGA